MWVYIGIMIYGSGFLILMGILWTALLEDSGARSVSFVFKELIVAVVWPIAILFLLGRYIGERMD